MSQLSGESPGPVTGPTREPGLAAALAEVARILDTKQDTRETLEGIVLTAQAAVPGFDHVGVSVAPARRRRDRPRIETLAATDPLVHELDDLQWRLEEGPCVDALMEEPVVVVEHARHAQRWPRYVPEAAQVGLRAQLAIRLFADKTGVGGLNFYSLERETVDPLAPVIGELFATHAAIALGRAREIEGLHEALASRKLIGQGIGILMERFGLDEERAFEYLLRTSQHSNVKLRKVAEELVADAQRPRT
ncbi:MAG: GAF and ANTAR domain-containing protein [Nocardioidaceae bacterium]